jgi:hypothetical protein
VAKGRGPRAEAFERIGGLYDVRVLEPSPPTVWDEPFLADDPVAGGEVVPLERAGAQSWDGLCRAGGEAALADWAADRWLGAWRRLSPLPASFVPSRQSLHALAEHVIAPARHSACGKIGLRYTRAGFGTPYFGEDRQVRVERGELVSEGPNGAVRREPISTLRQAALLADVPAGATTGVYVPTTPGDLDNKLVVEEEAAAALGDWFGFCTSVLEQVRDEASDASRVQIWPEHFDMAVDLGDESAGQRANYGGSPGDADHPEPYLYLGPWAKASGPFWNESFGASLAYGHLLAADDQRQAALTFLRAGRDLLAGGAGAAGPAGAAGG